MTTIAQQVNGPGCGGLTTLSLAQFDANRINVYYVDVPFTGYYCRDIPAIFIGSTPSVSTLAHELGHAFSLGETNGSDDYDNDDTTVDFGDQNMMLVGGDPALRASFTLGQVFRMTVDGASQLNILNVRTGLTERDCLDPNILSDTCMWIGTKITWD